MCVIIHLKPGVLLPYKLFETATFNNPHGYGVVLKDNNMLEVKRECPEGGNDPEKIFKILEENRDIERYVHLRWKTHGNIDLTNTQPFPAFISDKRQVYFMHNGVLPNYKKTTQRVLPSGGYVQDDDDSISDSRNFAETDLSEILLHWRGPDGPGDIEDPMLYKVLDKFWSSGSKGILISNNQEPLLLSPSSWQSIDSGESVIITDKSKKPHTKKEVSIRFHASNDDYFTTLKRGPVFDAKRAAEDEARRAANPTGGLNGLGGSRQGTNPLIIPLKSGVFEKRYSLIGRIKDLPFDFDLYDPVAASALGALTKLEWLRFIEEQPGDVSDMLMTLADHVKKLVDANRGLATKLEGATSKILQLVEEDRARNAA